MRSVSRLHVAQTRTIHHAHQVLRLPSLASLTRIVSVGSVNADGTVATQTINVSQIRLVKRIGKGSFAEVFKAVWRGSEIAVCGSLLVQ
jgi:hypothetical protein